MYAGCESENPLIGQTEDEKYTVIVDEDTLSLHEIRDDGTGEEFQYRLRDH